MPGEGQAGQEYQSTNEYELSNHEKHESNGKNQNHEWTRMDTNGKKKYQTTKSTKSMKEMGEIRTTNGHEWTKAGVNHETHEDI